MDKAYKAGHNLLATHANNAVNYLVPGLDDMSHNEAKQKLHTKAKKINAVLSDLADDPEVQQLIQESGEAFGKLTAELMEAMAEPVVEMSDRALDLGKQLAISSGKTLAKTGVDLVMSVLGEIPGVGGLVDLGVTGLVAFNGLAKTS